MISAVQGGSRDQYRHHQEKPAHRPLLQKSAPHAKVAEKAPTTCALGKTLVWIPYPPSIHQMEVVPATDGTFERSVRRLPHEVYFNMGRFAAMQEVSYKPKALGSPAIRDVLTFPGSSSIEHRIISIASD